MAWLFLPKLLLQVLEELPARRWRWKMPLATAARNEGGQAAIVVCSLHSEIPEK